MTSTSAPRTRVVLPIIALVLLLICLLVPSSVSAGQDVTPTNAVFIENAGQFAPQARYLVTTGESMFWVADDGIWIVQSRQAHLSTDEMKLPRLQRERLLRSRPAEAAAIRLSFAGASLAGKLEPFGPLETQISFLHGSDPAAWKTGVPAWSGVRVRDLYPGVDLVLGGDANGKLPWRIEAQPGANLTRVRLQVSGANDVAVAGGGLELQTAAGSLGLRLPALNGAKAPQQPAVSPMTASDFEIAAPFAATATAAPAALTDLQWATYLGGSGTDWAHGLATDASGNSYVVGDTAALDFPTTTGVIDSAGDSSEAFVAKVNATGTSLLYATYLGGDGLDFGYGIAVDSNNVAYVVGDTDSLTGFPGAGSATPTGQNDMFVLSLSATGAAVNWIKFFGGTGPDYGYGVSLDGGNVYATGSTYSTDFAASQTSGAGGGISDIMVAKLSTAGAVSYTAKVGGTDQDEGYAIKARNGEAYVAGETRSLNFPGGASIAGGADGILFKLATTGAMLSSIGLGDTLLGTIADDFAQGLALDTAGNVYVTGGTASSSFPTTPGTPGFAGGVRDAFVSAFSLSGTIWNLQFSLLIGGNGLEDGYGVAVDSGGGIYVTGETDSSNFPTTATGYDTSFNGGSDAFLVRVHPSSPATNRLTYSTFLGGAGYEGAYSLVLDPTGNALMTGATDSTDFPVTTGVLDTTADPGGAMDAWVAKLLAPATPAAPVLSIAKSGNDGALSWTQVTTDNVGTPMAVNRYRLWHSLQPFFSPGDTSSPSALYDGANLNFPDPGVVASTDNYYYVVNAIGPNGDASVNSNRVGEFTFALVKGQ